MKERESYNEIRRQSSTLGANLALAREAVGITQVELAEQAGTSRATIAQIESGDGDPRLSTLTAISEALGVRIFILLLGKQDIRRFVAIAQKQKDILAALPNEEEIALLGELTSSHSLKDKRNSMNLASDIATQRGFYGLGAAVGAAIGTTLMPGLGTIVGAFLCASSEKKKVVRGRDKQ